MSTFSHPINGSRSGNSLFSVTHFDVSSPTDSGSPIVLFDDFLVKGRPFGPHPHAGFSAITYVFEDSEGALRSRDSLGNDVIIQPGGIVWLQAGRGVLHEETPEILGRELHGAQIYVNLRAEHKMSDPRTMWLQPRDTPVWRGEDGNSVRILVGRYRDLSSALTPITPFNILDIRATTGVEIDIEPGSHTLVYARDALSITSGEERIQLADGHVVSIKNTESVTISSAHAARALLLSGAAINEPRHMEGPFILNHPRELSATVERYQRGDMGRLTPRD